MLILFDEDITPDIWYANFRKCTPVWDLPEQKTGACNLTYLIHGEARYTINDKPFHLKQGDLLFLPQGVIRKAVTFPDHLMQCFSVDFDLRNAKNRNVTLPFKISSQPGQHEDIIHMFRDLSTSWLNKQPGYLIKSRGLFLQIIHRFLELIIYKSDSRARDSRINKVIQYMSTHYPEHISVKMMAEMTGLNPKYFGTLFRREMKMSFNRYLIQTRIRNAENMLASGEYKVSNIAEACGFTDMSHFYRQFKLIKGFPPSHRMPKKF